MFTRKGFYIFYSLLYSGQMALLSIFWRVKFLYESCIVFWKRKMLGKKKKKAKHLHIPLLLLLVFFLHLQPWENTTAPGFPDCLLVPTLGDIRQHQRVDKSIEEQVHSRTQGSQLQLSLSLQISPTAHRNKVRNRWHWSPAPFLTLLYVFLPLPVRS